MPTPFIAFSLLGSGVTGRTMVGGSDNVAGALVGAFNTRVVTVFTDASNGASVAASQTVTFTLTNLNGADYDILTSSLTTDANGQAYITYRSNQPGKVKLHAEVTVSGNTVTTDTAPTVPPMFGASSGIYDGLTGNPVDGWDAIRLNLTFSCSPTVHAGSTRTVTAELQRGSVLGVWDHFPSSGSSGGSWPAITFAIDSDTASASLVGTNPVTIGTSGLADVDITSPTEGTTVVSASTSVGAVFGISGPFDVAADGDPPSGDPLSIEWLTPSPPPPPTLVVT